MFHPGIDISKLRFFSYRLDVTTSTSHQYLVSRTKDLGERSMQYNVLYSCDELMGALLYPSKQTH